MNNVLDNNSSTIRQAWQGIQQAKPGIRIREAAIELGLSEAELLATTVGDEAIRLHGNWQDLLKRLPELGKVMSLTRNASCVLEHKGPFQKVSTFGGGDHAMATVIGPIESRVFFGGWHVAFAVKTKKGDRPLTSLQVFDREGTAVTKIYLQEGSNAEAYEKIVQDFISPDQSTQQDVKKYAVEEFSTSVDKAAFLGEWETLKDTHDFFPFLKKHNVHRYHALELAEGKFTHRLAKESIGQILDQASETKLPIMIFAGNRGNLQIHQGKIRTIRVMEGSNGEYWLNVLDPDFNMHLRLDLVTNIWAVTKHTTEGVVTSVEAFDANNDLVVQFFGLRKPGMPELEAWKSIVNNLPVAKA